MKSASQRMPLLFIGHGSPMNAIEKSTFTDGIETVAAQLPRPKAILCISAHWETRGTFVTAASQPETMHDFGGFPRALYQVNYPAPGNVELAERVQSLLGFATVSLDTDRGFDHGCWAVVKYLFPKADIPVVELSLDYTQPAPWHYQLAGKLAPLREEGVLIVASGNLIHNLRALDWDTLYQPDSAFDWAVRVHREVIDYIKRGLHQPLIDYTKQGREYHIAIPSPDHFLPLLYILALQTPDDNLTIFNESIVGGALDMTSIMLG